MDESSIIETASDFVDEEQLSYIISNWLESFVKVHEKAFLLSLEGLKDFVHKKCLPLLPGPLAKSFPISVIKNILNKMISKYSTNKNIYFIDDKIVRFPKDIDITVNSTSLLILGALRDKTSGFIGDYSIYLDNSLLANDFKLFKEFIIQNQYYYNETATIYFLNSLFASLD